MPPNDEQGTSEEDQLLHGYSQDGQPSPLRMSSRASLLRRQVQLSCFALLVLMEIGVYLQAAPLSKILEHMVCRQYHPELADISPGGGGDDSRCKSTAVQGELATLRGWTMTFDYLPGILTAIPYGLMADKYGRKPVFILSCAGIFLNMSAYNAICWWSNIFPVRITWLCSFFNFIGGGSAVLTSMIFTMIADVTSEKDRSNAFFYLASSALSGELIASAVASKLMLQSPWLPILIGLSCIIVGICIAMMLPETLGVREPSKAPTDLTENEDQTGVEDHQDRWYRRTRTSLSRLTTTALDFIHGNKHVAILLSTFLMTTLGRYVSEILLQYATKRYHWSWARAGLLISLRALAGLLLLVAVLPGASHLLMSKLSFETRSKDLWLARASVVSSAIGVFCVGFSETPVIMIFGVSIWAFGSGYNLLVRSLLTSIVEKHHIGTLYNTMAVLETTGSLVAGPLLSTTFRKGLNLGGAWIGLPFIGAGVLFTTAAILICSVRLPRYSEDRSKTSASRAASSNGNDVESGI